MITRCCWKTPEEHATTGSQCVGKKGHDHIAVRTREGTPMTDKTMEGKELFQKFQRACMERPAPACGFAYDYDGEKSTTNQAVLRKLKEKKDEDDAENNQKIPTEITETFSSSNILIVLLRKVEKTKMAEFPALWLEIKEAHEKLGTDMDALKVYADKISQELPTLKGILDAYQGEGIHLGDYEGHGDFESFFEIVFGWIKNASTDHPNLTDEDLVKQDADFMGLRKTPNAPPATTPRTEVKDVSRFVCFCVLRLLCCGRLAAAFVFLGE